MHSVSSCLSVILVTFFNNPYATRVMAFTFGSGLIDTSLFYRRIPARPDLPVSIATISAAVGPASAATAREPLDSRL